VTERTIYNILRHQRKTGSLEPIRGRQGRKSRLIRRQQEILGALAQNPHLTLAALQTQLALRVSLPALWRALRRWGLRLKKSPARRRAAAS
jgi:transposase